MLNSHNLRNIHDVLFDSQPNHVSNVPLNYISTGHCVARPKLSSSAPPIHRFWTVLLGTIRTSNNQPSTCSTDRTVLTNIIISYILWLIFWLLSQSTSLGSSNQTCSWEEPTITLDSWLEVELSHPKITIRESISVAPSSNQFRKVENTVSGST